MADNRGLKRKKRRSFLSRQQSYGKKGKFGRGTELSEDQYQYFIRILEVSRSDKTNSTQETLATNALEEIKGKESDICSNQMASRVIEELLSFAPDSNILTIGSAFGSELRLVYTDPYCSHVLQKLMVVITDRVTNTATKSQESTEKLISCFVKMAMFGVNNIDDFIFDSYANHCLRTIFACVSGRAVKEDKGLTSASENIPSEFEEISKTIVERIIAWPQFNDLTSQELPTCCLQALVMSVRENSKLAKKLTKKIIEACRSRSSLDFSDDSSTLLTHLMENTIQAAPIKLFRKIFNEFFKGNVKRVALNKNGNFLIQKLLLHCPTKEIYEEIYDELSDCFDEILNANFNGLLTALAKKCRLFRTKEGEFSKSLMASLHCNEPIERRNTTLLLICCLKPYEKFQPDSQKLVIQGCLLAEEMLAFTKPIRLVSSLLSLDDEALLTLLSDRMGCHITDSFCSSNFVGEKNREKLYRRLQNKYVTLAASKHGSRSFDAIWATLSVQQKVTVMDELKAGQSSLVAAQFGLIIARKVQLDLFREDREKWIKQIKKSEKCIKEKK